MPTKIKDQGKQDFASSAVTKHDSELELVTMTFGELRPLVNPDNWRDHDDTQREAFKAIVKETGWAKTILLNRTTNRLINGHMRLSTDAPDSETAPVLIGSWTPDQEKIILATLDPTAAMAEMDEAKFLSLISECLIEDAPTIFNPIMEAFGVTFEVEEDQAAFTSEPYVASDDGRSITQFAVNIPESEADEFNQLLERGKAWFGKDTATDIVQTATRQQSDALGYGTSSA